MAAADRTELDAGNTDALEVDDIGGSMSSDADRVAVEVPCRNLAEHLHKRVSPRDVGRLVRKENLHLGGEVYRADLTRYLPRVLLGQVADVQVVGCPVRDAVYHVATDD